MRSLPILSQTLSRTKKMVVLVVIPADSDFQNAAALKLARRKEVDPKGTRTLGVVTKVSCRADHVLQ